MSAREPSTGPQAGRTGHAHSPLRKERERTRRAVDEAAALARRLAVMEASASWRMTAPVRRLSAALPPAARDNMRRALRLLWLLATFRLAARLRARAAFRRHVALAAAEAAGTSPAPAGPRALVIDDHWPQPTRDAGSVEIMNLIEALLALGFQVTFAASLEPAAGNPDRDALAQLGVRCLASTDDDWMVNVFLAGEGGTWDLCVLSRVYCGGRFMEAVQRYCKRAPIVFNTIDLHYVRIEREARLRNDAALLATAGQVRRRELQLICAADATIVVSAAEQALLAEAAPQAYVVALPLAREVRQSRPSFSQRTGIGFIGGFAHAPNIDAVRYFLSEIWPLILRALPDCEFTIVGAGMPDSVLDGAPGRVRYLGHVPDVGPWFDGLRLTVAPLRFGAGLKGKVVSSIAAGVPCVATSLSVEGMEALGAAAVLVADGPAEFAANAVRVCTDEALWTQLSAAGSAYVRDELSIAGWRKQLAEMLWTLGLIGDETPPAP